VDTVTLSVEKTSKQAMKQPDVYKYHSFVMKQYSLKIRDKKKHAFDCIAIQQYTIAYLKIAELSTKRAFVEIFKYHVIEH
jgi:hypothetical protein